MEKHLQKILLAIGERLAIIIVLSITVVLLLTQNTQKVFSEQSQPTFVQADAYWYQNGVAFDPPEAQISFQYVISEAKVTPTPTPVIIKPTEDIWDTLAKCEAGGNWSTDTGNGYYGGLQFNQGAWNSVGGTGKPSDASRDEQIMRGKMLQEKRGWGVWGLCAKKLGLN